MVGLCGLEPQTSPACRDALTTVLAGYKFRDATVGFPALDLSFPPSCCRQCGMLFLVHQSPWTSTPRVPTALAGVLRKPPGEVRGAAHVESSVAITPENVYHRHKISWWVCADSNRRPPACQAGALTNLSYRPGCEGDSSTALNRLPIQALRRNDRRDGGRKSLQ